MSIHVVIKNRWVQIISVFILCGMIFHVVSGIYTKKLLNVFYQLESIETLDRSGELIYRLPNAKGYRAKYVDDIPNRFTSLLLQKEDQWFYYHFGVNPWSNMRAAYNYILGQNNFSQSTITQQLVKNLLSNEQERTLGNKIIESWYALMLEWQLSKEEILTMYANSIYFGQQVQGLQLASQLYFGVDPSLLTDSQMLQLLATLSSPSVQHPFTSENEDAAASLAQSLSIPFDRSQLAYGAAQERKKDFYEHQSNAVQFELRSVLEPCKDSCKLTIDTHLNEKIRDIVQKNILLLAPKKATHGAVVVIKIPENELLAVIGSPDPKSQYEGDQINMALRARPIGSTLKPFIFLKGFEKGLRPYTVVEDREYKYEIDSGFAFYPKNYDYQYRGDVTLHYALANSLNVPVVKVLEYIGIDDFANFLVDDMHLYPTQDIDTYQLGFALGQLEMDLLSLSYYFSLLANQGEMKPLLMNMPTKSSQFQKVPNEASTRFDQRQKIADAAYVQLINRLLSDRETGIEQFGMNSNLNVFRKDSVAVKTGTSRNYHDSWTVGYTPDFVVGVWVGNTQNEPMDDVAGSVGAGRIWQQVMNVLLNSEYATKKAFDDDLLEEFFVGNTIEFGLKGDNYVVAKNALLDQSLILQPHNGDVFLLENAELKLHLQARDDVEWLLNNKSVGKGSEVYIRVTRAGQYTLTAKSERSRETLTFTVQSDQD